MTDDPTAAILDDSWAAPDATVIERKPRTCRRHQWHIDFSAVDLIAETGLAVVRCARCGRLRDDARVRRNRGNRNRGKSTSAELAKYLGWQNVEGLNWPWDIQGKGGRIQSKRDATGRSGGAVVALIEAIPAGTDYLRGLYRVAPRQRLTSGTVALWLREWVDWHGWLMPPGAKLSTATAVTSEGVVVSVPLIEMPLAVFRDVHVGRTE